MTGILLIDKPENISSAGVIRALKRRTASAKVGHVGTLDPFASGLLPLCIGEATKVARYLLLERKAYRGVVALGVETDTLDRTGQVVRTMPAPAMPSAAELAGLAERFVGPRLQRPPMYSALKRDGVPLYALARRGVEVPREPRPIEIFSLSLAPVGPGRIALEVECSKGTYIRVLAAELGEALGTVAHLEQLRRTRVGEFRVEDAASLDALVAPTASGPLPLLPLRAALADLPAHRLPAEALARLTRGQQAPLAELPRAPHAGDAGVVIDDADTVVALIEATAEGGWRLVRLIAAT